MKIFKFALCAVILIVYFAACEGIICYKCSNNKQRCLDGDYLDHEDCDVAVKPEEFIEGTNITACVKIVQRTNSSFFTIERGCRPAQISTGVVNVTISYCTDFLKKNPKAECTECLEYFCNGGHGQHFMINKWMPLLIIPVVMWLMWMKRQS